MERAFAARRVKPRRSSAPATGSAAMRPAESSEAIRQRASALRTAPAAFPARIAPASKAHSPRTPRRAPFDRREIGGGSEEGPPRLANAPTRYKAKPRTSSATPKRHPPRCKATRRRMHRASSPLNAKRPTRASSISAKTPPSEMAGWREPHRDGGPIGGRTSNACSG